MLHESRDLTSARRLLSEFESEMSSPGAVTKLSEALSLLSDIVEAGNAEGRIARNVVEKAVLLRKLEDDLGKEHS